MTAEVKTVSRWAVARGRYRFLEGLQKVVPPFWESLAADVWLTKDAAAALPVWLDKMHVIDGWFAQAVKDTLDFWTLNPDSPTARLLPGVPWFYYAEPIEHWEAVRFTPTIERAHPVLVGEPRLHWETRQEFAHRMRCEFEKQLKSYMETDYLGDAFDEPGNRPRDIEWTVARFCGVNVLSIVEEWVKAGAPGLSEKNADPEQTVRTATGRFAREIGLTFPS